MELPSSTYTILFPCGGFGFSKDREHYKYDGFPSKSLPTPATTAQELVKWIVSQLKDDIMERDYNDPCLNCKPFLDKTYLFKDIYEELCAHADESEDKCQKLLSKIETKKLEPKKSQFEWWECPDMLFVKKGVYNEALVKYILSSTTVLGVKHKREWDYDDDVEEVKDDE